LGNHCTAYFDVFGKLRQTDKRQESGQRRQRFGELIGEVTREIAIDGG
jgi:hypothetical protein